MHASQLQRDRTEAQMGNWVRKSRVTELTIVVSAMEPKLLIKMLQVTFTGGPAGERRMRGLKAQKETTLGRFR